MIYKFVNLKVCVYMTLTHEDKTCNVFVMYGRADTIVYQYPKLLLKNFDSDINVLNW